MKLYRTTFLTQDDILKEIWHPSSTLASKCRTALKKNYAPSRPETLIVDVPTGKAGLIMFLNVQAKLPKEIEPLT